jgi:hypothetical protein
MMRLAMTEDEHIGSLKAKHARLDRELREEQLRPMPDSVVIASLKREKLKLKDEMARLEG